MSKGWWCEMTEKLSIPLSFFVFAPLPFPSLTGRGMILVRLRRHPQKHIQIASHISMHEAKLSPHYSCLLFSISPPLLCAIGPWCPHRVSSAEYETTPVAEDASMCVGLRKTVQVMNRGELFWVLLLLSVARCEGGFEVMTPVSTAGSYGNVHTGNVYEACS